MLLTELPFEITLRVSKTQRTTSRFAFSPTKSLPETYKQVGYAPLMLPERSLPTAHWYTTDDGIIVGVNAEQSLDHPEALKVTYPQTLLSAIEPIEEYEEGVNTVPWELAHDFRKTHVEVAAAAGFLSELPILINILIHTQNHGTDSQDADLIVTPDGLSINPKVIEHLLSGHSLYELPGVSEQLHKYDFIGDILLFDTLFVSVESPFLTKIRGYLKWDGSINVSTLIGALILVNALSNDTTAEPNTSHVRPISCSIEHTNLNPKAQVISESCEAYRSDIENGGVLAKQKYLFALGYDVGPFDGIAGEKTISAVTKFCSDNNIVCTGIDSNVFVESLLSSIAFKFPIISN